MSRLGIVPLTIYVLSSAGVLRVCWKKMSIRATSHWSCSCVSRWTVFYCDAIWNLV